MFCINLFQPSPNAFGANIPKLKKTHTHTKPQTNKTTRPLSQLEASLGCGAQFREALESISAQGKHAGRTAAQESPSLVMRVWFSGHITNPLL